MSRDARTKKRRTQPPSSRRRRRTVTSDTRTVVWTLREQGHSLRAIEADTGIDATTVWRILQDDPVRNEALEARLRAKQASEFEEMASKGREAAILWLDGAIEAGKAAKVKSRRKLTGRQLQTLTVLPRVIQAAAQTARHSTQVAALLQGRATERVERTTQDLSDDPDALIDNAIDAGVVEMLPPALRAEAKRRVAAKG